MNQPKSLSTSPKKRPPKSSTKATKTPKTSQKSSKPQKSPKISVIIPVYNTGLSAVQLIHNLLKNPYPNLEIIAVDDGSTDDSFAKLKNIKNKDLKIFHQANAGASSARNLGLKHATGDFISFLDSDDQISPQFFTELLKPFRQNSVALSVCGFRYHRLKQGTTKDAYVHMLEPRRPEESFKGYILRLLASDGRMYSSVNKLYRAEIIRQSNLQFDQTLNFAEDTKFVLDYLAAVENFSTEIAFILKPLYIYNYGTDTSTVTTSSLDWKNWQISYINLETWLGPHPDPAEHHQLARVHRRWRISHALAVARSSLTFRQKTNYLNPLLLPPFLLLARLRK